LYVRIRDVLFFGKKETRTSSSEVSIGRDTANFFVFIAGSILLRQKGLRFTIGKSVSVKSGRFVRSSSRKKECARLSAQHIIIVTR